MTILPSIFNGYPQRVQERLRDVLFFIQEFEQNNDLKVVSAQLNGSWPAGYFHPDSDIDISMFYMQPFDVFYEQLKGNQPFSPHMPTHVEGSSIFINDVFSIRMPSAFYHSRGVINYFVRQPILFSRGQADQRIYGFAADVLDPNYYILSLYAYLDKVAEKHLFSPNIDVKFLIKSLILIASIRWIETYGTAPPLRYDDLERLKFLPDHVAAYVLSCIQARNQGHDLPLEQFAQAFVAESLDVERPVDQAHRNMEDYQERFRALMLQFYRDIYDDSIDLGRFAGLQAYL